MRFICSILFFALATSSCKATGSDPQDPVTPGAYFLNEYIPLIENKKVGICTNQSGLIGKTHLVDSLVAIGIEVAKVFSPEHGFRGKADAGEKVENEATQDEFDLISLYGKNRKPTPEQMQGLDIMIFDIQDVGVRFFTYLSTMTYLMEACAEAQIPLIILDRPNPNGSYVDGPVMESDNKSFLGMHEVPIVHGMTPGEFAQMLNGESWLETTKKCEIKIVKVGNWKHDSFYSLPVKPSPNLPDDISISWYPNLCLFEQTICSVGRGTDKAFQHIGHPDYPDTNYVFIPRSREGAKNPVLEDQTCYGIDYGALGFSYEFSIRPLIDFYQKMGREDFFKPHLHRLAGTRDLQRQIEEGWTEREIKKSWEPRLTHFKQIRSKYLLYD